VLQSVLGKSYKLTGASKTWENKVIFVALINYNWEVQVGITITEKAMITRGARAM